jgi:flagellar biosynthesis chaperone FliJ
VDRNTEEYPSKLGACVDEFLRLLDQSKDTSVWEVYVTFLEEEKAKTKESTIVTYVESCLNSVLQEASSRQLMTPKLYLAWYDVTKAPKKLKTALKHYPDNAQVWKKYVEASVDKSEAYKNALHHLSSNPDIWEDYLRFLKDTNNGKLQAESKRCLQQFLNTHFETRMLLQHMDLLEGPEFVEQYQFYLNSKQQSLEFFEYLIQRELATSSDQLDLLFQKAHDAYPTNTRTL